MRVTSLCALLRFLQYSKNEPNYYRVIDQIALFHHLACQN
jgi:hypothetical protein